MNILGYLVKYLLKYLLTITLFLISLGMLLLMFKGVLDLALVLAYPVVGACSVAAFFKERRDKL
jgi:hypothetical protein